MQKFRATVLMDVVVSADSVEKANEKWGHIVKHGFYKMDVLAVPGTTLEPSWVPVPVPEMED